MSDSKFDVMSVDMISHVERDYTEGISWGADKFAVYGEEDDLPEYLQEIYESSPIHGALVNSISDLIYGDGLFTENGNDPDAGVQDWLEKNQFGMDGEDTLKLICLDIKKNGICFVEVIRGKDGIATLFRSEPENWRLGKMNEKREIDKVWYSETFKDPYQNVKPVSVPTWKPDTKEARSILVIRMPVIGRKYYPRPDYYGCAMYAELDKEIGSYHLNNILNGMAPSMSISLNNGIPETKEKRAAIKKEIQKKLQGTSNAGKILVTFNEGKEQAPEFETFALSEAHLQYDQLAKTVVHQILVGHRVISPLLHGVRDFGTGFSSNAEEMALASRLFERNVIKPFRTVIEKALFPVLKEMGQTEKLYFTTPELETLTEQPQEEEEQEELAAHLSDEQGVDMLLTAAETVSTIPSNWTLVDAQKVTDRGEFKLSAKRRLEGFFLNLFDNRTDIKSKPTLDSVQDSGVYKVRYAYMPIKTDSKGESRDFCQAMVAITKKGGIFRFEDIELMGEKGVNQNLGHKGQPYSIWLHAGGVYCHHFWERRIYKESVSKDNRIGVNEARREGFKPPVNDPKVAQREIDDKKSKGGHHPNYEG